MQVVALCMQRHDPGENGFAPVATLGILGDDSRANFNFLPEAQDTGEDRTASNTALELFDLRTGLVDVERTNDNKLRVGREVTNGDGDALDNVFVYGIDVVFELGGYRDDG